MTRTTLDLTTAPSHVVLAAAGKTVLRPGGRAATEQLFQWANFKPGNTVLELASGLGNSAIDLAKRYTVEVVGIEKDEERVKIAQSNVHAAGLPLQVQIVTGDIFHLEAMPQQFDYVFAEAILTMQSPSAKAKILAGIYDRLKPGGIFLSHEMVARDRLMQIHQDLSRVTRVNATPLPELEWIDAFSQAGLTVIHHQTGEVGLLNPLQILRDEGLANTIQFFWTVLTQPVVRDRVLTMRQVFNQHRQDLGYITLCAMRPIQ